MNFKTISLSIVTILTLAASPAVAQQRSDSYTQNEFNKTFLALGTEIAKTPKYSAAKAVVFVFKQNKKMRESLFSLGNDVCTFKAAGQTDAQIARFFDSVLAEEQLSKSELETSLMNVGLSIVAAKRTICPDRN